MRQARSSGWRDFSCTELAALPCAGVSYLSFLELREGHVDWGNILCRERGVALLVGVDVDGLG